MRLHRRIRRLIMFSGMDAVFAMQYLSRCSFWLESDIRIQKNGSTKRVVPMIDYEG